MSFEENKLNSHFRGFENIWKGGYFEGDPLDPLGPSKYRRIGYISLLHAIYLACIKPYIHQDSFVLEIGPGRGAWTKTMLKVKEIWCLDAKSREDNQIDQYLEYPNNLTYFQVTDFSCKMLPNDTFTYMFSYGCLCHVPWTGIQQYAENLYEKLKTGAQAFWMVADYDKRNHVSKEFNQYDIFARTLPVKIFHILEWMNRMKKNKLLGPGYEPPLNMNENTETFENGRWYHSGASRTAEMLRNVGYQVICEDVGLAPRDAIVHFFKP